MHQQKNQHASTPVVLQMAFMALLTLLSGCQGQARQNEQAGSNNSPTFTLQVSATHAIQEITNNSQDTALQSLLAQAHACANTTNKFFPACFIAALQASPQQQQLLQIIKAGYYNDQLPASPTVADVENLLASWFAQTNVVVRVIILNRLKEYGIKNATVTPVPNSNHIEVVVPGNANSATVKQLIAQQGQLDFYMLYNEVAMVNSINAIDTLLRQQANQPLNNSTPSPLLALTKPHGRGLLSYNLKDTATINAILARADVQQLLPQGVKMLWAQKLFLLGGRPQDQLLDLYAINTQRSASAAALNNSAILTARVQINPIDRSAEVNLGMTTQGAEAWQNLTASNIGKRVAVVLDNKVYIAPTIRAEVPNGRLFISNEFSQAEATALATILSYPALRVPVSIVP